MRYYFRYLKGIVLLTGAFLLLSSCSKEKSLDNNEPFVAFGVDVDGCDISAVAGTKSALKTSIDDYFMVTAWNNTTTPTRLVTYSKVVTEGKTAPYASDFRWTKPYNKIFFAYANLPSEGASISNNDASSQVLTYSVPVNASNQSDILMASVKGEGEEDGDIRKTSLSFKHPLTSVLFEKGTWDEDIVDQIKGIEISGIYSGGTISQSNDGTLDDWTVPAPSETITVKQESTAGLVGTTGTIGVPFIVIPQASASLDIKLTVSLKNSGEMILAGKLANVNWQKGKKNIYTVSITGLNELQFSGSVSAWGAEAAGIDMKLERLQQADEIWYKTSDNSLIEPKTLSAITGADAAALTVTSHEYDEGSSYCILKMSGAIKSIGTEAFADTGNICTELLLPTGLTAIEHGSFEGYKNLGYLYLPGTITSFTGRLFKNRMTNQTRDWVDLHIECISGNVRFQLTVAGNGNQMMLPFGTYTLMDDALSNE